MLRAMAEILTEAGVSVFIQKMNLKSIMKIWRNSNEH